MLIKNCAVAGTVWNLLVEELLCLVLRLTGHIDAELLKGVFVDLGQDDGKNGKSRADKTRSV